jgi:transcriptional regulator with XRE-family HTH domain
MKTRHTMTRTDIAARLNLDPSTVASWPEGRPARTTVTVLIDRDPRSLGADATELDVEQFRARLEDLLSREYPDRSIIVVTGETIGFECGDPEIEDRMCRLETTDEWLELVQ